MHSNGYKTWVDADHENGAQRSSFRMRSELALFPGVWDEEGDEGVGSGKKEYVIRSCNVRVGKERGKESAATVTNLPCHTSLGETRSPGRKEARDQPMHL